ncbi:DUF2330 domain-containing protein [Aetokthonos hydrillicola Thurmond2011]|jgi:hypothetical protein|uniref:DUF2330 domain-containing protein n=1 Tax=Aetokthonos hydrillicola Thurmond2011 TaxID=2712845 RepID=A0AAP5MDL9_9CYAN|nr:DUF2330 domain-containing protein [Aetokthonos hydrillicola]MBO3459738.1 DUF2330 domain-containing protein [Aetokthonos hydrillicola CCALA 1050]MBW4585170.1 DUF2330 domain-containing protein [Aetokthonos hydrillicola CCALA 1050]MDR9899509.1 DUF2330 domain-containing protein [Aetokthonos hydrillicola Thurmond2011]
MKLLRLIFCLLLPVICAVCFFSSPAWAFCGFYVAKADAKLYNKSSQVAIARSGDRTVLTMANDYQGAIKDFAIVVPVPTVLQKDQVRVANPKIIERLDAFSAPRLVEYFDPDPCARNYRDQAFEAPTATAPMPLANLAKKTSNNLGVTVEARFNVGEYDIVILSAKESGGLETWLNRNGYKIPRGAKQLLQPYIRQKMKFFVAKVNLEKFEESGYQFLRPLQISYQSPKFMLPIRLGMINATTEQDLIVYILSPKGQAEVTNYRTVKVPSDVNIPLFVQKEFNDFYKSMFQTSYTREDKKVAFLEYAWNMSNCDPCSADPLNPEELKQAGVFWLDSDSGDNIQAPSPRRVNPYFPSSQVFITRLHVRYKRDKFPEDLMFQDTSNRESFQGRYILQHPFTGDISCQAGREYKRSLSSRFETEAETLAKLTTWNIQEIRSKMKLGGQVSISWWQMFLSWLGL